MIELHYNDFLREKFPEGAAELQNYLLMHGIEGLLNDFEEWLIENHNL